MALAAAVLLSVACESATDVLEDEPREEDKWNLSISDADPEDGNGKLVFDESDITYTTDEGVEDLDKLTISASSAGGTIAHEIEILWVPATGEVRTFQHFWGPVGAGNSGSTRCALGTGNVCDPAKVSVDQTATTLTCSGAVLLDMFGGTSTSTVSGSVQWGDDPPNGGDH
jgi:hypothetical protein